MIVNQLQTLHAQAIQPYRPLCAAATMPYATFMRWKGRLARGVPVLHKPGPKPVGSLDLAGLQTQLRRLEHGARRSHGTTALYAQHRSQISRRSFHELVEETRRQILRGTRGRPAKRPLASARHHLVVGPYRVGARAGGAGKNPHANRSLTWLRATSSPRS